MPTGQYERKYCEVACIQCAATVRVRNGHKGKMCLRCRLLNSVKEKNGCWEWTGAVGPNTGYGMILLSSAHREEIAAQGDTRKGRTYSAHKLSYMLFKGPVNAGQLVCHACDNRLCINPDHLFLGSHQENMDDCKAKGRWGIKTEPDGPQLTDDEVRAIRADARPRRVVAMEYNRTLKTISRIRLKQVYANVPDAESVS